MDLNYQPSGPQATSEEAARVMGRSESAAPNNKPNGSIMQRLLLPLVDAPASHAERESMVMNGDASITDRAFMEKFLDGGDYQDSQENGSTPQQRYGGRRGSAMSSISETWTHASSFLSNTLDHVWGKNTRRGSV